MNFLLPVLYAILFSWLILKIPFFKNSGIKPLWRIGIFWIKILTGMLVIYIYTHFYSNPTTADILLYYGDGKIIFNSLKTNPSDYFKMLFGIGTDANYFTDMYFSKMQRWNSVHDSMFFNDCRTIIRFNAFFDLFSFGAFHVNTVMMCFLSFTGLTALYRAFEKYMAGKKILLAAAIFFPPTLLFWSSGVLKEGILMFTIGLFVFSFLQIFIAKKITAINFFLLALSIFFFLINKVYILFTFFPALLCFVLFTKINFRFKFLGFILVHSILIAGGLFFFKVIMNKDFVSELITKQQDFINVARGGLIIERDSFLIRMDYGDTARLIHTKKDTVRIMPGSKYEYWVGGRMNDTLHETNSKDTSECFLMWQIEPARSAYYMPHLKKEFSSFAEYAPKAFFNVLLRPYITEAENLYQKACSAENIFYILTIIFCFIFGNYQKTNWPLFWLGIFFAFNLFLIIGFTTPVAGALVRYKSPALPFLLISAFSLLDVEKVKRIPLLKYLVAD